MNLADANWLYIIFAFGIGAVCGALLLRLVSGGLAASTNTRQKLKERELELDQVKDKLNEHFTRTATSIASLSQQLSGLEQQLSEDAAKLISDSEVIKLLNKSSAAAIEATAEASLEAGLAANFQPPKDYAANHAGGTLNEGFMQDKLQPPSDYVPSSGGTLAEDFGLQAGSSSKTANNSQANNSSQASNK